MNYNDCAVSDDDTSQQSHQGQQSTDQSPSSSAQATPLAAKVTALESMKPNQTRSNRRHPMSPRRISKEREEV